MNVGEIRKLFEEVGKENGFKDSTINLTVGYICRHIHYNSPNSEEYLMSLTKKEARKIRGINPNGKTWELIEKVQVALKERSSLTVFLSHKMNGLKEYEVLEIRRLAKEYLECRYGVNIYVIDNFHHDNAPEDAGRLWHLGESIKMMERADGVYFCPGWMDAKGCQIEYDICRTYGLRILE